MTNPTITTDKEIILLGAYGFTALKIVRQLNQRKISFSIAGRDSSKLEALKQEFHYVKEIFIVDIESDNDLEDLLDKTDILISCIGPYNIYGPAIIEKAVQKGIVYLDITGEQHIVQESFLKYKDKAEQNGACIIHSLSFESALMDLLAAAYLAPEAKWEELSSAYYFERSVPSAGTRMTMQTSKFFPTYSVENRQLTKKDILSFSRPVEYPDKPELDNAVFMPYPEVLFFHRRYAPERSSSYLLIKEINAKYLMAGGREGPPLETIIEREKRKKKKSPSHEACENQYFEVILFAKDVTGRESAYRLSGKNMYEITANILVSYLSRMLDSNVFPAGIHAPSESGPDPRSVLDELIETNEILLSKDLPFRILCQKN